MTNGHRYLYEFGPFRIDSEERLLLRDGQVVPLPPKAFDTLVLLVRSGGRLVYATCSLLSEENEAQVTAFLARRPGFALVPLTRAWPGGAPPNPGDYLSLTPARHGTDGFFAAVLERRA